MISKFSLFLLIPSFIVSSTLPLPLLSQAQMAQAAEAKTAVDAQIALAQRDTQTFTVSDQAATISADRDTISATSRADLDAANAAKAKAEADKKAAEEAAKVQAAADAAAKAVKEKSSSKSTGSSSPALPSVTPDPGSAQAYAQQAVKARGWSDSDFSCLVSLWNKESGWRVNAFNPSGAYGIPQALPGAKMASAGSDWATNPNTQIDWGLGYIASVYGTPCNAWAHSQSVNWY